MFGNTQKARGKRKKMIAVHSFQSNRFVQGHWEDSVIILDVTENRLPRCFLQITERKAEMSCCDTMGKEWSSTDAHKTNITAHKTECRMTLMVLSWDVTTCVTALCPAAVWTVSCSESIFKGQTGANSPVAPLSALLLTHSD